jgi:hypothetical protein
LTSGYVGMAHLSGGAFASGMDIAFFDTIPSPSSGARMGEHGQPIFDNVFVQQDAGLGIAQQASRRGLRSRTGNRADSRHRARSSRRRRGSRFERPCDGATIVTSRSVPRPDQGPQSRQLRGSASAARWEQVIPTGCTPLSERPGALAFSTRQPSGTAGKKPAAPSEKVRAGKLDKLKLSRGARSSPGGAA